MRVGSRAQPIAILGSPRHRHRPHPSREARHATLVRRSPRAAAAVVAPVAVAALAFSAVTAAPATARDAARSAAAVTKADLRAELLTAAQFAPISTREGWHPVDNSAVFDCGALAATKPAQVSVRRSFSSDPDASRWGRRG